MKRLTKREFILKARKIHGKKYLYHKVEYINYISEIKIYCRKCKKFFCQKPVNHLNTVVGCFDCGLKSKTKTYLQFEKEANKIHKSKYKYCHDYKNNQTFIEIICPIHGKFSQRANTHLSGYGCQSCNKVTFEEFEEKANKKHLGVYLYFQDYVNSQTAVKIYCIKCKKFFYQTPVSHVRGYGCSFCNTPKNQNEVFNLVSNITKLKFQSNVYLPELNRLELDIYNKRKRLAIEYNGEGHYLRYINGRHFFTKKHIKVVQKRDRKKKRLCKRLGIKLIVIPCYEYQKLKTIKEKRQYFKNKLENIL